jgi:hypothetical protein
VLRRARRAADRGRYTHSSARNDRVQLRQALNLLDWLEARGMTIAELTQPVLDDWLTEGDRSIHSKVRIAQFLAWTTARRLTGTLAVPRQRFDTPSRFLGEEDRLSLLRRCLTADDFPLGVRVAGALVLLFGLRLSTVTTLTADHLTTDKRGTYLTATGARLLLPPSLARLAGQLAARSPRFGVTPVKAVPRYLLPGRPPSRPTTPAHLEPGYASTASTPARDATLRC